MYHVSFPGLGIDMDINNQINIFGLSIYWYGIIIAVGLILAVVYGTINSKRLGISPDSLLNCVIVGVITGIIGARAYYVIFNWGYYSKHLDKIIAINEGGLAIYGGIIGALIGGLIVAKICKMNIPATLDVAAVGFLIGQGIGRWGNFFNQEAYGIQTDLPWGMISEGTNNVAVHPCFLYESIWCLLGALLIHLFSKTKLRKYHGQMALLYVIWYGAERALVEGLRTDSLYIPNTQIRVSQLLSIIIFVAGLVTLIVLYIKKYENLELVISNREIEKVFEEEPKDVSDEEVINNNEDTTEEQTEISAAGEPEEIEEDITELSEEESDKLEQQVSDIIKNIKKK